MNKDGAIQLAHQGYIAVCLKTTPARWSLLEFPRCDRGQNTSTSFIIIFDPMLSSERL